MKNENLQPHSEAWCEEMKKTCEYCKHTKYHCVDHEPWHEMRSSSTWGGMHHQKNCPFLYQLLNKEAHAVVRYTACVHLDFVEQKNFNGNDIKCPDCEGWDIEIRKDY